MEENKNLIIVEGLIGVGKSTALSKTDPELSSVFKEEYDTELLDKHYNNPSIESSYDLQVWFRGFAKNKLKEADANDKHSFLDRSAIGCLAFTLLNLSIGKLDHGCKRVAYALMDDLNDLISRKNLCVIYFMDDHRSIMKRVRLRGREFEKDLQPDYQKGLQSWYAIILSYLSSKNVPILTLYGLKEFEKVSEMTPDQLYEYAKNASKSSTLLPVDIKKELRIPKVRDPEEIISYERARKFLLSMRP